MWHKRVRESDVIDSQRVGLWREDQYAANQKTPIAPNTTADQIRSAVASAPAARTMNSTDAARLSTPRIKKPAAGNSYLVIRR